MRQIVNFNHDWLFCLEDQTGFAAPEYQDQGWTRLNLPHDWSVSFAPNEHSPCGGGGGYATAGTGWYRKHFDAEADWLSRRVLLQFDGVYMDSTVYLNGHAIGGHGYGYSSFVTDCTGWLKPEGNVLAVRVDNSRQPNSRWYTGSGIYRDVFLIAADAVHMAPWGLRCCTNGLYLDNQRATLQIQAAIANDSGVRVNADVIHRLLDAEGNEVCVSGTALQLEPGQTSDCMTRPEVTNPHLWTDDDPYLYTLISTVVVDQTPVDEVKTRIGIRTAAFDCDRGFLLNGERVKIKGMCVHHDCGLTGAVGYRETWERRLRALKEMGCNGIRCAHNPPTPALLDLCDELGFLVMDEIFDEWKLTKDKNQNYYSQSFAYGSSQFFEAHAEEDLVRMLRRDYNHPSVILWSIGNEIPEQSSIDGVKILRFLQDICHREDTSRMVTSACDNIVAYGSIRTLREFENALDVVGYNYVGRWRERAETFYDEDRHDYPQRRMCGSENGSVGGRRGVYDDTHSFFGPYESQSLRNEALWRYTASHDFVAGDYLWTGIAYLGETRWPSRGADSGPLDTAGFKKDAYYYFRSIWNRREITLHLLPHWNWPGQEGVFKPVVAYTNCEEVALYINGRLVARRGLACPRYGVEKAWNERRSKGGAPTTNDLHLVWDVPYEPGELKAVGYIDGEPVAECVVQTTGAAERLAAHSDRLTLAVDGIAHVDISALDAQGRVVPDAAPVVACRVTGPAHLVGMDSGDLTDLSLYGTAERKMSAGLLLAMIQADAPGAVTVTFTSESLQETTVTLEVR